MARWSILPCFTSGPAKTGGNGTYLTLPTWRLLPVWRPYCMIPCWGYPPQKRPDPGLNRTPPGLQIGAGAERCPSWHSGEIIEQEQSDAQDRNLPLVVAQFKVSGARDENRRHR